MNTIFKGTRSQLGEGEGKRKSLGSNRGGECHDFQEAGWTLNLVIGPSRRKGSVFRASQGRLLPLDVLSTSLGTDGTEENVHLLQTAPLGLWDDQGESSQHTDIDGGIHDEDLPPEGCDPRGSVVGNHKVYDVHVRITTPEGKGVNSTYSITTGRRTRRQGRNVSS